MSCLFHGLDVLVSLICITYSRPGIRRIHDKNYRYSIENAMNQFKVMDVAAEWALINVDPYALYPSRMGAAPWDVCPFMPCG